MYGQPGQPPHGQQGYYAPPQIYQQAPGYGAAPPAPYNAYPAVGAPPAWGAAPPGWGAPHPGPAGPPAQQPPYNGGWAPPHGTPPPQPGPAYAPPPAPAKKAVLIGCSYPGTNAALNGCINDVKCLQHLLTTKFGFQPENIVMLKDDVKHPDFYPTRANIYRSIQWLMTGMQHGSSLFFSFSGHGSQKQDFGGDEDDGMDETILPTDYKTAGQILDDELNQLLVRPLPPGVVLHAVVDACHSGTVLDLPYRTKMKGGRCTWKGRNQLSKQTAGGTCLQFGACRDSQVAADTNRMSGTVHTGAATFSFIQAIERGGTSQSYGQVLSAMSMALEGSGGSSATSGMANMVMGLLLGGGLSSGGQTPVLSCDKPLDLNTRLLL